MDSIKVGSITYTKIMEKTLSGAVLPLVTVESSDGDYIGFYDAPQLYACNFNGSIHHYARNANGSIVTMLTQEEVDDIIAQYQANNTIRISDEGINSLKFDYQMDFGDYEIEAKPTTQKGCKHQWKNYVGLNHKFTYCTLCDEKK